MTKPTLAFIGAGTLGTVLSLACAAAEYRVLSIHSRTLEDAEDLASFDERADESLISYEEMVKRLKKDGRI